jgi:hypothetical protein
MLHNGDMLPLICSGFSGEPLSLASNVATPKRGGFTRRASAEPTPNFKAMVDIEEIRLEEKLQETDAERVIHPIQVSQWKQQLLAEANKVFNSAQ